MRKTMTNIDIHILKLGFHLALSRVKHRWTKSRYFFLNPNVTDSESLTQKN